MSDDNAIAQSAAESKAVVRQYFEVLDRVREHPVSMCTDDYKFTVLGSPTIGLQESIDFGKVFFEGIPDLMHPLDELIAEGDTVAFRYHYEGTHTRELIGAPPTGNKIHYYGMGFMRVRDGKVSEFIVSPDRVTLMQQIGLLPAEG
ncbi:ester cyclase [Paractinoplanes hotanensis]|uniref:Ester cyclase n=1 Tax=Paractinoplanes hotanensis TaxID=2906497 RepID=A0ABT0YDW9_9ACTN|nr:ester cyclase [Actinoplanes hotanensis]MCM4083449.1 ester cyclase [Actinoplanes hotanensis]